MAQGFGGSLAHVAARVVDQASQYRNRRDHRALSGELGGALAHVGVRVLHEGEERRFGDRRPEIVERAQRRLADVGVGVAQRFGDGRGAALRAQVT